MVIPVIIILGRHMPNFAISFSCPLSALSHATSGWQVSSAPFWRDSFCLGSLHVFSFRWFQFSDTAIHIGCPDQSTPLDKSDCLLLYGLSWGTGAYETSSGLLDLFYLAMAAGGALSCAAVIAPWISF